MSGETPSASGAVGSCAQCSAYEARCSEYEERLESKETEMEELEVRMNENDAEKMQKISQLQTALGTTEAQVREVTAALAQLRVSVIPESRYKGKSISAVFRIPRPDNNDLINYVYSSLQCSDKALRKEEIKFQEEQLNKIKGGFPDAQLITFMYRENWELTKREVMKSFSRDGKREDVRGGNGMWRAMYPLKADITDCEIMSAFWDVMKYGMMADYTDDQKRVYDCSLRTAEGIPPTIEDDTVFIKTTIPAPRI